MEIHDHFDGSSHCVECNGPCRLKDESLMLTRLVRYVFDLQASEGNKKPNGFLLVPFEYAGVDWRPFWKRALETCPARQKDGTFAPRAAK